MEQLRHDANLPTEQNTNLASLIPAEQKIEMWFVRSESEAQRLCMRQALLMIGLIAALLGFLYFVKGVPLSMSLISNILFPIILGVSSPWIISLMDKKVRFTYVCTDKAVYILRAAKVHSSLLYEEIGNVQLFQDLPGGCISVRKKGFLERYNSLTIRFAPEPEQLVAYIRAKMGLVEKNQILPM